MTHVAAEAGLLPIIARGARIGSNPGAAQPFAAATRFTNWLERLGQWAERQPMHRHLGSYLLHDAPPSKR